MHWNPLQAQIMQKLGGDGYQKLTRIYIKPINVTLLSGDSKCTIYEDKHVSSVGHLTNNGTLTDSKTHLMWQQEWDGEYMEWNATIAYCNDLSLAGYNDWRLPNIKELQSIIYVGEAPAIFPNAINWGGYWSSTTDANDTSRAWILDFDDRNSSIYSKTDSRSFVRCVRARQ